MKEKAGMMGLAVIAAALLTAISVTVSAIAESKGQGQTQGRSSEQSQDRERDRDRDVERLQYPIYGSQLMSEREREMHRSKMRSFKTEQEREAYRLNHHKLMQDRARAKGVTLPEEPPKLTPPATN